MVHTGGWVHPSVHPNQLPQLVVADR